METGEEDSEESDVADMDLRSDWCVENGCLVRFIKRIDVSAVLNGESRVRVDNLLSLLHENCVGLSHSSISCASSG